MPSSTYKRYTKTETLENILKKYKNRIKQLKTIQLKRQTELALIMNQPEAWIRSQNWGSRVTEEGKQNALKARKEELSAKNVRLDILLMKAEGGKITQGMFDYTRGKLKEKGDKSLIERFNLKKADGTDYVVGDTYVPTVKDRATMIENIEEILEERQLNEEIGYKEETPNKNFPTIQVKDPNNKLKTNTMDKEDYLSGTDFRDEQQVLDSLLLDKLRIQKENVESKSDLTKQLTIQDF
tara:strand:- start:249 stop:965 length:717 start_codon:yes stop_codon:yes gene_type:complete